MGLDHYRTLGRSGLRVSPLVLGAMNFDDRCWGTPPDVAFDILERYFELGGNFVDTANASTAATRGEPSVATSRSILTSALGQYSLPVRRHDASR